MKKLLIAAAATAMLMTAAAPAKAGNDWIGPAIFGTIFGVIIANNGRADTVYVERRPRHLHYRHRHHRRHARNRWVEVCKGWPRTVRDRWGDYHVVFDNECRWVKKAIW